MEKQSFDYLTQEYNQINMNILENGLFYGDKEWLFNDIVSSFNRMYFIIDGNAYITDGIDKISLEPGNIYLIPANSKYTYVCPNYLKKFYIHFELQIFPGLDIFSLLNKYLQMPLDEKLINTIISLCNIRTLENIFELKSIFYTIIGDFIKSSNIFENYINVFSGFYKQKQVLSYVKEHLGCDLKIQVIADNLNIPYHTLTRNFKQDTGVGLKKHIDNMILQKSKHLLLQSKKNISEIAEELHFCDCFYFSRFFKNAEEITPSEYRMRHTM